MNKSSKAKSTTTTTTKKIKSRGGHPSLLPPEEKTKAIKETIALISAGYTIVDIAKITGINENTLNHWIADNTEGVAATYAQAREARADKIAREIFEIADTAPDDNPAAVQKAKLRADVRRWYLSKILPEKYGDNLTVKSSGTLQVAHIGAVAIADVRKVRSMLDSAIAPADDDLTENGGVQTADNC